MSLKSFNPFQGFIRVFTPFKRIPFQIVVLVLIPSRDLLGFSPRGFRVFLFQLVVLIPSRDLLGFSRLNMALPEFSTLTF